MVVEAQQTDKNVAYAVWQTGRPAEARHAGESEAFTAGWDAREARIEEAGAPALTFVLEGWNIVIDAEIQEGTTENGWMTVAPTGRCFVRTLNGLLVGATQATMPMSELGKVKRVRVTVEPVDE